jgi:ATP-dependent DNA helicase PIF1
LGVADSDKESISYTKTCKVISEELKAKLFQEMTLPARVELFLGAQVMLLKNLSFKHGLVNGSIGKVVDFLPISSKQFATAAASKTTSITGAPDDECDALLYGQSDWMRHVSTEHNNFIIHLPRVKFPGLANPVLIIPFMERLDFNNFFNETSPNSPTDLSPGLARYQIPLRLAYAYTIHKSQGQTLPLVEVDVRRLFEYGQAYVALSRATGFRGLRVVGYADTDADDTDDGDDISPDKFSITKTTAAAERFWKWQVHQRVAEFYNSATSSS